MLFTLQTIFVPAKWKWVAQKKFLIQVMASEEGKSRGFGFVCYEDPEAAEKACDDMHAKDLNGN